MNYIVSGHTTTASVDLDHRASRARRLFGVIVQPQSYRNVAYWARARETIDAERRVDAIRAAQTILAPMKLTSECQLASLFL